MHDRKMCIERVRGWTLTGNAKKVRAEVFAGNWRFVCSAPVHASTRVSDHQDILRMAARRGSGHEYPVADSQDNELIEMLLPEPHSKIHVLELQPLSPL